MVKAFFVFILMAALMGAGMLMVPEQAAAQQSSQSAACTGIGGEWKNGECEVSGEEANVAGVVKTIADALLGIIGAVAVIMLIIGGFRYVVSAGDSSALESAKNTIIYAIVGIVVAFMAYAAVRFIVTQLQ